MNNYEDLIQELTIIKNENNLLKLENLELKEHLKKYTAPSYKKAYYENNKEEIKEKQKKYLQPKKKMFF